MQQQTHVKASQIIPGLNPRKFFDAKEMAELESSILAQGIIQPISVRPVGDKFEIVAGERRWRAAKAVHGEDYEIPVFIREMTDEEAAAAGANENIIRAAMSPAEESEVASRILGQCNGNYDEAAKRLGWARGTLEKRLALMNCSENVRNALTERKIQIGHAELFATATKDKQDKVLEKILNLPSLPTVQEFKQQLEQVSKTLSSAIFDKAECAGCQFNSTNQAQLFAEAISDGHCTNGSCYDAKTEGELTLRSEKLKEEFPVVKILRPGENFTLIKIVAEGATGVGEEQAVKCRACANYGGVVSSLPNSLGKVYVNQCFDPACNSSKVAARIKAEKDAAQAQVEAAKETAKTETKAPEKDGKATVAEKAAKPDAKATVVDSTRIKEYRVKVWRTVLVKELLANDEKNKAVLLALGICGLGRHISGSKLTKAFNKLTGNEDPTLSSNLGQIATLLMSASDEAKARLHQALAASVQDEIEESNLRQLLNFLEVDMAKHWQLNKDYLDLMTKSEIEVIATEIGLKAHIGEGFSKLMGSKKDELVAALLKVEGFEYAGKVPNVMQYQTQ